MKSRKSNLWMAAILLFALLTSGFQIPAFAAVEGQQGTVSIFGTDEAAPLLPEKTIQLGDKETATEALESAVGKENVEYSHSTYGDMVTAISGLKAEGTNYWAFYVNGVAAQMGADTYIVQNGDKISFRYTDWTKPPQTSVSIKVVDDKQNIMNNLSGITIIGHPTALQLLQTALGPDKVGVTDTQYGKMITSINGMKAEGTNYWAFYINGKMAPVGADSYQLQPNDQISFQFESWQAPSVNGNNGNNGNNKPIVQPISSATLNKSISSVGGYVMKEKIGEWEVIAMKQTGRKIPASYLQNVIKQVTQNQGQFHKITDTERYVLGILAAGGDPTNIEGYNLVKEIYNGNVTKQGLIGVAYALVALDSAHFQIPASAVWTREKLENYLLEKQNKDGGWAWDESSTSDIDTTAMILSAFAPYKNQANMKVKIDKAVQYLSKQYLGHKINNSTTASQVVIALSSLGINASEGLFADSKSNLLQYLLSFQNKDGGFGWKSGDSSDPVSSTQGFQALAAYQLYTKGSGSLYQLPLLKQAPVNEQAAPATNIKNGHSLPDTASNAENLLLLGAVFILIGMAAFFLFNRRKSA